MLKAVENLFRVLWDTRDETFGNARLAREVVEEAGLRLAERRLRGSTDVNLSPDDIPGPERFQSANARFSTEVSRAGDQLEVAKGRSDLAEAATSSDAHRPHSLKDFVGQTEVVSAVNNAVQKAREDGDAIPHLLLVGAHGLGKRTMATLIAEAMGTEVRVLDGTNIERKGDVAEVLVSLGKGDIFYIDGINHVTQECADMLATAIDDFRIDLGTGTLPIERFTLIGGMHYTGLAPSLQERLSCVWWMQFYSVEELVTIVWRAARTAELILGDDAAREIAKRSRSPGQALSVLRGLKVGTGKDRRRINVRDATAAFDDLGIDERGLDDMDRRLVAVLAEHHGAAPVALTELEQLLAVTEDEFTGERTPWLVRLGLVSVVPNTGACKLTSEGLAYARRRPGSPPPTRHRGSAKPVKG